MQRRFKVIILALIALVAVLAVVSQVDHSALAIFNTKGIIADQEKNLMFFALGLSMFVVIPVFILTFYIAWKYRAGNTKADYKPDWDGSVVAESVWWGLPCLIILILSIVTWQSSHTLDPYRPLESDVKPITIQVVALPWKWLFIYPEQNIATVNEVHIPTHTPINFEITSDAAMNSFWIPELAGQIYAMNGMNTKLHLMANEEGNFRGVSANLSGEGFADMHFSTLASDTSTFNSWVESMKDSSNVLSLDHYTSLAQPGTNDSVIRYASVEKDLYNQIIMKYMSPLHHHSTP